MKGLPVDKKWAYLSGAILLVGILLVFAYSAFAGGSTAANRWVFGSGGEQSRAENVVLNDTIGQPIIGHSDSITVSLEAGFWLPLPLIPPLNSTFLPLIKR